MERKIVERIKLNLGSGNKIYFDYINIDLYAPNVDIRADVRNLPFKANSIEEILAIQILEHFNFAESWDILKEWKRVLKPEGLLWIETPDFLTLCQKFAQADEWTRTSLYGWFFAKPWLPGESHLFMYTEAQLCWTLEQLGFLSIKRVEPKYSDHLESGLNLAVSCRKGE